MSGTDWVQVAADTKLNEILERYSSVGPILVQAGRGWVNKPGDLYAQFPDLTVAQYAELNGLEVGRVLRLLQAAAEAEERTKKAGRARATTTRSGAARRSPSATRRATTSARGRAPGPSPWCTSSRSAARSETGGSHGALAAASLGASRRNPARAMRRVQLRGGAR